MGNALGYDPALLGRRIKEYRTSLQWSQTELADRADVSRSVISALERGLHGTTVVSFVRITWALGRRSYREMLT